MSKIHRIVNRSSSLDRANRSDVRPSRAPMSRTRRAARRGVRLARRRNR